MECTVRRRRRDIITDIITAITARRRVIGIGIAMTADGTAITGAGTTGVGTEIETGIVAGGTIMVVTAAGVADRS
jgi:hypothetical protein